MENDEESHFTHDDSCLCIQCYAKGIGLPDYKEPKKAAEVLTHPVLRAICCPPMTIADWALEDCERERVLARDQRLRREYKDWLHNLDMDPSQIRVIYRGQTSSVLARGRNSTTPSEGGVMTAPGPVPPMKQNLEMNLKICIPPRKRPTTSHH